MRSFSTVDSNCNCFGLHLTVLSSTFVPPEVGPSATDYLLLRETPDHSEFTTMQTPFNQSQSWLRVAGTHKLQEQIDPAVSYRGSGCQPKPLGNVLQSLKGGVYRAKVFGLQTKTFERKLLLQCSVLDISRFVSVDKKRVTQASHLSPTHSSRLVPVSRVLKEWVFLMWLYAVQPHNA